MRAAVLLCLLGSALVECQKFHWGGPETGLERDLNIANECLVDEASCGCCLIQQKIHKMETYFATSLNNLEKEMNKTKDALDNVKASRTAFSVALMDHDALHCYGPFRDEESILYKYVFINLGDAYNVETGIFTVPRSGVYSLAVTVYSDAGAPGNTLAACASLLVNGVLMAGPNERNLQDQEDSATVVLALHLRAGDQVAVHLPIGCFLCDNKSHYNTFSGFLLYPTA